MNVKQFVVFIVVQLLLLAWCIYYVNMYKRLCGILIQSLESDQDVLYQTLI